MKKTIDKKLYWLFFLIYLFGIVLITIFYVDYSLFLLVGFNVLSLILATIIHELGHLVFGLISNYQFVSFRIFNFMLIKENNKIKIKSYSIPNTLGQCLLLPRSSEQKSMLYNLGGVIFNFLTIVMMLLLLFINNPYIWLFSFIMINTSLFFALTNGVPLKVGLVSNDGKNAQNLKDKNELRAFNNILFINYYLSNNCRLDQIDEQYFTFNESNNKEHTMSIKVVYFSRLLAFKKFEEALTLGNKLLNEENVLPLYKLQLQNDLVYLYCLNDDLENVQRLYNDQFIKSLKPLRNNISVLRTKYVYHLLVLNDNNEKIYQSFINFSKVHPYKGEVMSEVMLIDQARNRTLQDK